MGEPTQTVKTSETTTERSKAKRPNRNVYIGKAYEYWQDFKQIHHLTTDTDVAFYLLSVYVYSILLRYYVQPLDT